MTKEEAIKIVRENMHLSYDKGNIFEALKILVPELAEWNEDEWIRTELLSSFKGIMADADEDELWYGLPYNDIIAWLEKQKEQKSTKCIEFADEFENQVSHLLASVLNGEYEYNKNFIKYAAQSLLGYAKNELKSTEWCKEDENKIERLAFLVSVVEEKEMISPSESIDLRNFIKSLCPQPKQEWSEEDEKCIKDIIDCLKYLEMEDTERQYNGDRVVNPKRYADMIAKLKSLRPQPKQEWSEEDKGLLVKCISALQNSGNWFLADKLSSLCPHPSWKPTEEQLEAAQYVSQFDYGGHKAALESLYEQLKKLQS